MNITDIIREETTNNNITEYTTQMMETSTQNNGIIYSQIENSTSYIENYSTEIMEKAEISELNMGLTTNEIEYSTSNQENLSSEINISSSYLVNEASYLENSTNYMSPIKSSSISNIQYSESEINNTLSKIETSMQEILSSTHKKEIKLTSLKTEFTTPIEDTISLQPSSIIYNGQLNLNNTDINLIKIKNTSLSEFKAQIMKRSILSLINAVDSSEIINDSDFIALIFLLDSINPKEQIEKGISAIDLGNCTNVLKEHYHINKDEYLYVLNIESKRNKSE